MDLITAVLFLTGAALLLQTDELVSLAPTYFLPPSDVRLSCLALLLLDGSLKLVLFGI